MILPKHISKYEFQEQLNSKDEFITNLKGINSLNSPVRQKIPSKYRNEFQNLYPLMNKSYINAKEQLKNFPIKFSAEEKKE